MNPINKDYKSYKATQFAKDTYFIHWQFSCDADTEYFWINLQKEQPHLKPEIERAIEILQSIKLNANDLSAEEKATELAILKQRINHRKRKTVIYRSLCIAAAAACLFIGIFLSHHLITNTEIATVLAEANKSIQLISSDETLYLAANAHVEFHPNGIISIKDGTKQMTIARDTKGENRLIVPKGKRATLTLSDGSHIWINSESELTFPTLFAKSKREIEVSGETYLEIAKDAKRPFTVKNQAFQVEVLGTKFNISAYPHESVREVVLLEGSVKVKSKHKQSLILRPKQMATITTNEINSSEVQAADYINWTNQVLSMESRTLTDVLRYLERYYDVEIAHDATISTLKCNGKLILSDSINQVLDCLKMTMPLQIEKENHKIKISLTNKLKENK